MKKKILFLGASHAQVPAIKYAKEKGFYVIACDQKKDSPGFKFSDEIYKISTINKTKILKISKKLKINGIVSYVSDISAPTAAFVSQKMGLIGNSTKAVNTLVDKELFRNFLKKNKFNYPEFKVFKNKKKLELFIKKTKLPVFIKPIDSSGSKGVTKVIKYDQIKNAMKSAIKYSNKKKIIVEEIIQRKGNQIAGDGFVINGKLVFRCWGDENFNEKLNGIITIGPSFPSKHSEKKFKLVHKQTQKLLKLVGIKNGALNFDFIFDKNDNLYFLEIAPRNGGGLLPELIKYLTNVDLIKYTVEQSVGNKLKYLDQKNPKGLWSSYMIHSTKDGKFKNIFIKNELKKRIVYFKLFVKKGDRVKKYVNAQHILGNLIFNFKNKEEMSNLYRSPEKFIRVNVD